MDGRRERRKNTRERRKSKGDAWIGAGASPKEEEGTWGRTGKTENIERAFGRGKEDTCRRMPGPTPVTKKKNGTATAARGQGRPTCTIALRSHLFPS